MKLLVYQRRYPSVMRRYDYSELLRFFSSDLVVHKNITFVQIVALSSGSFHAQPRLIIDIKSLYSHGFMGT